MKARDGIITADGLTAEFRFMYHAAGQPLSRVETATGMVWLDDSLLEYDPPRDLSPEAAAVVADLTMTRAREEPKGEEKP